MNGIAVANQDIFW